MSDVVFENELTVEVAINYEKLCELLNNKGFKLTEEYDLIDIYMLKNDCVETAPLEILKNCVLIRNIITEKENIKAITYKYKEYNEQKEIVRQGKAECKVQDLLSAEKLLSAMGYHRFIKIVDHSKIFSNGQSELAVQLVNDKHLYIEFEQDNNYKTIQEMKEFLDSLEIPLKSNNYFVKKAEIEILECANC